MNIFKMSKCSAHTRYQHKEYPREIKAQRLVYSEGDYKRLYRLYYSAENRVVYVIMHGSEDGRTYDGVMAEEAIQELCLKNIEALGERPIDKFVVVCCYPGYHKDTEVVDFALPVEFISNSIEPILIEQYDNRFIWYPESEYKG